LQREAADQRKPTRILMEAAPIRPPEKPKRSSFLNVWRGEIGLYRAAYGLGGLGLALVSLLGDGFLSSAALAGGLAGGLSYIVAGTGELAFAWITIVATWRAARTGRPDGALAYGSVAIGVAFAFVGMQFVLTAGWVGWNGLAGLGAAPEPEQYLLRALAAAIGGEYGVIGHL
jgi:hypothetical protein